VNLMIEMKFIFNYIGECKDLLESKIEFKISRLISTSYNVLH